MKATVEISMYPLSEGYETPIIKFIERLKSHEELEVRPNNISTQIFGNYDRMMAILQEEMKKSFMENESVVCVMKVINLDLR